MTTFESYQRSRARMMWMWATYGVVAPVTPMPERFGFTPLVLHKRDDLGRFCSFAKQQQHYQWRCDLLNTAAWNTWFNRCDTSFLHNWPAGRPCCGRSSTVKLRWTGGVGEAVQEGIDGADLVNQIECPSVQVSDRVCRFCGVVWTVEIDSWADAAIEFKIRSESREQAYKRWEREGVGGNLARRRVEEGRRNNEQSPRLLMPVPQFKVRMLSHWTGRTEEFVERHRQEQGAS